MMLRLTGPLLMMAIAAGAPPARASQEGAGCRPNGALVTLADLPEASGLAIGKRSSARLWLHNDSGAPVLLAVDAAGKPAGRLTIGGARVEDWEALAAGPCGKGSCLFVGDIGDNNAKRKRITIYRIAEPAQPDGTATADVFHATYPDGSHDAETLLVAPDGTVLIVTKGETGPVAVYKFPRDLKPGSTVAMERLGSPLAEKAGDNGRITDGAFSADGQWVVLRTRTSLTFYRAEEFMRGTFKAAHRVSLAALKEPQGEAVAFGSNGTVYIAGEGGGKNQPGTLAALSCNP
jgi:hypothetical protein